MMDRLAAKLIGATQRLTDVEIDVMNLAVNGLVEQTPKDMRRVLNCIVERIEKAQEDRAYDELAEEEEEEE